MAVFDCSVCDGVGIYAGNGETCQTCLGWGHLRAEKVVPCNGIGEAQTVDIETAFKNRKPLTFEEYDRQQVERRAWNRLTAMALLTPEWTDD